MKISIPAITYIIEILLAELIFLYSFDRRKGFWLRLIGGVALCVVAAMFFPDGIFENYTFGAAALNFARYFLLFSLSVAVMYFCFLGEFRIILSACTAGYAVQHLTQRLNIILSSVISLFGVLPRTWGQIILVVFTFLPVYLLIFFFLGRKAGKTYYKEEGDVRLDAISIAIMLMCMLVTRIQDFGAQTDISRISNSVYAIICCLFVLVLQFTVYGSIKKDRELHTTKQLYAKRQEEYQHWQNSIDMINVKCHDLKHRIAGLRQNYSESYIREIEESVMIYDSTLKTGNEVLDVILFEKNIFCERNKIEFIYMVDGAALNFIENDELFALFTNLIDNAIEASLRVEPEKKVIQLNVKRTANMVFIHAENYYAGEIKFENGYPVTLKADKENHGYGIRSMKMFSEKYGGTLRFSAENGIFSLTICIPSK
ncbi:MAG: sensor histidine kinase, partial [Clostridia bacterium]|nr:sensor histidine kinase [Clostridia bacterium]